MDKGRTNYPICSKEQTTIEGLTTPLLTQLRNLPMMKAKWQPNPISLHVMFFIFYFLDM